MLTFSIEDSSSRNKYEYRVSNGRKTNFPASIGFLVTIPATAGLQLCIILFHFAWVHRWMKWMDCSAGFCRRLSASFCCCILLLVEEVLVLAWSGWGRVESSRAWQGSQAVSWRPVKADLCYSWLRFSMHSAPSEPLILPSIFSGFRTHCSRTEWSPRWRHQLTLFILFYFSSASSLPSHMALWVETETRNDDRSSIYRMSFCISLTIDFCLRFRFYSKVEHDLLVL